MKGFLLFFILIGLISCGAAKNPETSASPPTGGFCGQSTAGNCQNDGDCIRGGCSGQVCQSKAEEAAITTCEWRDCYRPDPFGVQCGCVKGKCRWH